MSQDHRPFLSSSYMSVQKLSRPATQEYLPLEQTIQRVKVNDDNEFPTVYRPRKNGSKNTGYEAIVSLYNNSSEVVKFRVFKDNELGVGFEAQKYIHETRNDDDRQTTETQLERSIAHTLNDLKKGIHLNNPNYLLSQVSSTASCTQREDDSSYCSSTQYYTPGTYSQPF